MEDNRTYISPRGILERFQLFEEKIPLKSNEITDYVSSLYKCKDFTEDDINAEAFRMLQHVGMGHYRPKCVWRDLGDRTMGCIVPSTDCNVEISLNAKSCTTRKVILATLAHEICHKLLLVNGIEYKDTPQNEYAADLCTIYVGFAQLIFAGYESSELILGYLKHHVYTQAYNIVLAVRGKDRSAMIDPDWDLYLSEALEEWDKGKDKRRLIEELFSQLSQDIALFHRNVNYLQHAVEAKQRVQKLNEMCFIDGAFSSIGGGVKKPISVFRMIYEITLEKSEPDESLVKVNESLAEIIAAYISQNEGSNGETLHQADVYCPMCGAKIDHAWSQGKTVVHFCSKCKSNFLLNRQPWNQSAECRILNERQREKERKINDLKLSHQKEMERLNKIHQQQVSDAHAQGRAQARNTSSATKYLEGVNDGRAEMKAKIEKCPAWLKFFLKKYLR